jgi:glycine hydroxymethyltransferase
MQILRRDDMEVADLIEKETVRSANTLDLIAAESLTPPSVLEAAGSIFLTKAAEGYPGRRFHAGCRCADELEALAVARGKRLFGAEHVNVQPHSGSSANLAVYFAVLVPGDRILAMKLSHGGHLTHGAAASLTSRCFEFAHYGVHPQTEQIDYDEVRQLALKWRPKMIVAGASSYARLIDYAVMAKIARDISAYLLIDMAHIAGLVAARVIPSPVPHGDFVTFTTYKTLMGGRGGVILCRKKYKRQVDQAIFPGSQGTPALNEIAAKAVCFNLAFKPQFIDLQKKILYHAKAFAQALTRLGYRIVAGGTDNHLLLIDLRPKGLTGDRAEAALESAGIVANRNVIPGDPQPPDVTSGIRIGTTAITARGMGRKEVNQIAEWMDRAMIQGRESGALREVAAAVQRLCRRFPIINCAQPEE